MSAVLAALALDTLPNAFAQSIRRQDPSRDFEVSFEAQRSPLIHFKAETFRPYVGGVFKLRAGAKSVESTLVTVRDCTPGAKSKLTTKSRPTECFALVFRADEALTDLTTIYDVEHGALGKFALFLTRRDGPRGAHFYEAVFNRAL